MVVISMKTFGVFLKESLTNHRDLQVGHVVLINGTMRYKVVDTSTMVGEDVTLEDAAGQRSRLFTAHVSTDGSGLWWTGQGSVTINSVSKPQTVRRKVTSLEVIGKITLDKSRTV